MESLTPVIFQADPDVPAARIVLLNEKREQIGVSAYSITGFGMQLMAILDNARLCAQFGLTERSAYQMFTDIAPEALHKNIGMNVVHNDLLVVQIGNVMAMVHHQFREGTAYHTNEPPTPDQCGLMLHGHNGSGPHAHFGVALGGQYLQGVFTARSVRMLEFLIHLCRTRPAAMKHVPHLHVQTHLKTMVTIADQLGLPLPQDHPQDGETLRNLSDICDEDLLPLYTAYKRPIG